MSPKATKAIAAAGGALALAVGAIAVGGKVDCSPEARTERIEKQGDALVYCGDDRECWADVETEFRKTKEACKR